MPVVAVVSVACQSDVEWRRAAHNNTGAWQSRRVVLRVPSGGKVLGGTTWCKAGTTGDDSPYSRIPVHSPVRPGQYAHQQVVKQFEPLAVSQMEDWAITEYW